MGDDGKPEETSPHTISISLHEEEIVKAVLEFLESRRLSITQLSLERETGVINGNYSRDILFLRQLILDGQWNAALDFIEPMCEVASFDGKTFRYLIAKYKYFELLCIRNEPGSHLDDELGIEEIVECLNELENYSPSKEHFRRFCALLTIPKLLDLEEFRSWNPSNARMECFHKILPLVFPILSGDTAACSASGPSANNERLIQLICKGLLYESAVEYCQQKAIDGRAAPRIRHDFSSLLKQTRSRETLASEELGNRGITPADLSLVSWLSQLGDEQFTIPFQQKSLGFSVGELRKPTLDAKWSEQILQMPIKPRDKFPHALVPRNGLVKRAGGKILGTLSQSMVLPATMMMESVAANCGGGKLEDAFLSARENRHRPGIPTRRASQVMSKSTAPSINFTIRTEEEKGPIDSELQRQSQMIDNMLVASTMHLESGSDSAFTTTATDTPLESLSSDQQQPSSAAAILQRLQPAINAELGSIRTPQPRNLPIQNSAEYRYRALPTLPELGTPDLMQQVPRLSQDIPIRMDKGAAFQMAPSYTSLLEQFMNRPQVSAPQNGNYCQNNSPYPGCVPMPIASPYGQPTGLLPHHSSMSCVGRRSSTPPLTTQHQNRPKSFVEGAVDRTMSPASMGDESSPRSSSLSFEVVCRYEDMQAVRTAAFHPSGKYFALGTNSKHLLICKCPERGTSAVQGADGANPAEILLSRPKQHKGSVYCSGFNSSGTLIATGSNDKSIRLMSFSPLECKIGPEMELLAHDGTVRDLIFMEGSGYAHGCTLVSGGAGDCSIKLTDCSSGTSFASFRGHTAPILSLYSWGANAGTSFVSCSLDGSIRFWDIRAESAVDPSGRLLVSGHEDASISLYDVMGKRVLQQFRPHGDEVRTVRCSNAAYYLLSGSYDKRIVITDIRGDLMAPLLHVPIAEHKDKIIQCRWHPHTFTFLSTSADRTACLWALPENGKK